MKFNPDACERCPGHCCSSPGHVVWSEEEWRKVHLALGTSWESACGANNCHNKVMDNRLFVISEYGPCPFHDQAAGTCRIYPLRPRQCRAFPHWPTIEDKWNKVRTELPCPGMEEEQNGPSEARKGP